MLQTQLLTDTLAFFFFSLQDFILEHYSEDSYLYEDDIADLMDLRQVRAAVRESALFAEASGHRRTNTSRPGESGTRRGAVRITHCT